VFKKEEIESDMERTNTEGMIEEKKNGPWARSHGLGSMEVISRRGDQLRYRPRRLKTGSVFKGQFFITPSL